MLQYDFDWSIVTRPQFMGMLVDGTLRTLALGLVSAIVIDLVGCARTIVPRTRTSAFEDASERCMGTRVEHRRSDFSRRMPQSTTRSTSSGIC